MNNDQHSLFLPKYEINNPITWFIKVENLFSDALHITEKTKFTLVKNEVAKCENQLPNGTQSKIKPFLIYDFQTGDYEKFKNVLISNLNSNSNSNDFNLNNKNVSGSIITFGTGGIQARNVKINAPQANNSSNREQINAAIIKGGESNMKFENVDINIHDKN